MMETAQDLIDSVDIEYTADELLTKCFNTWAKANLMFIKKREKK